MARLNIVYDLLQTTKEFYRGNNIVNRQQFANENEASRSLSE